MAYVLCSPHTFSLSHFVSSLPFLKEKSSDENTYAPCVIETLSLLGTLMKFESEPLRQQIAQAVADFCSEESNDAHTEGQWYSGYWSPVPLKG